MREGINRTRGFLCVCEMRGYSVCNSGPRIDRLWRESGIAGFYMYILNYGLICLGASMLWFLMVHWNDLFGFFQSVENENFSFYVKHAYSIKVQVTCVPIHLTTFPRNKAK